MCYLITFVILDFDHHLQKSWHPVITVTPPTPRKQLLLHLPLTQGFFPLFRKDLRGQCLLASVWVGRWVCVCVCRCIGHPLGVCARASECALLWVDFFLFWNAHACMCSGTNRTVWTFPPMWKTTEWRRLISLSCPCNPAPILPSLFHPSFLSSLELALRPAISLSVAVGSFTYKWSC